jgi:hypothetical protein
VPSSPADVVLVGPEPYLAIAGFALVVAAVVIALQLLSRRRGVPVLLALCLLSAAGSGVTWIRRYTVAGVGVLGGSHYWVARAAHEPSNAACVQYLQVPLSVPYGVGVTESAVLSLYHLGQETRLFKLLARTMPEGYWRARYRFRATGQFRTPRRRR